MEAGKKASKIGREKQFIRKLLSFYSASNIFGCRDKNLRKEESMTNEKKRRKRSLLNRDGNTCFYTGEVMTEEEMTIEHLIPLVRGGSNKLDNLVLCKQSENEKMGAKPLFVKLRYREANLFTTRSLLHQLIKSIFKR